MNKEEGGDLGGETGEYKSNSTDMNTTHDIIVLSLHFLKHLYSNIVPIRN